MRYSDSASLPPEGRPVAVAYNSSAFSGMARTAAPDQTRAYEDLRREARKLESDLEAKLSAFSKLTNRMDSAGRGEAGLAADQLASSKESAIEDTLRRLSDVIDSLSGVVTGSGDSRAHTLARHRDIFRDLSQEFKRLKASCNARCSS